MGMILRIASSRIVGQGDIVGRSGYFSLNLSANSVMRGRLDARRTLKSLVADLRINESKCRFSLFSERKNDTCLCDIPYYNKINPLIYSVFTSLLQVKSFKGVCVRPFLAFCRGMRVPLRRTC